MNTFAELRSHLTTQFNNDPEYTLDSSELTALGSEVLNASGLDPILLQRLKFLLSDERDGRYICFNTEAVVFGILTHAKTRSLARDSDIQRFMNEHGFCELSDTDSGDYHVSRERKNKYIDRSHRLTKRVMKKLELPTTELVLGRNDMCKLYFVSSDTFLRALFACKNTKAFSDYGARFMKLHSIYDSIKLKYMTKVNKSMKDTISKKDRALAKKDEAIAGKKDRIEELLQQMRDETREGFREVNTKVDTLNVKIDTLVQNVDDLHADHTETAYHATAVVTESESPYFAMTTFTKPNDTDPTKKYFRTWRTQQKRMMKELAKKMTETTLDRNGSIIESEHELVISPCYFSSPVNVPIQSIRHLKLICKSIAEEHNDDRDIGDIRWSMTSVCKDTGINFSKTKPVWVANEYISLKRFINSFLDVIKESQGRSFQILDLPDELQTIIDRRRVEYDERLSEAQGSHRDQLKEMVDAIREARIRLERLASDVEDSE